TSTLPTDRRAAPPSSGQESLTAGQGELQLSAFPPAAPAAAAPGGADRPSERCPPSGRRKPLTAAAMVASRVGLATLVAPPEIGACSVSVLAQAPELAVTAALTPRSQQVPVSPSPV